MRVAVSCDHAGYIYKDLVIETLVNEGHEVLDLGTNDTKSVDIPDFAEKAGRAVQEKKAERAVILCGSGVGACITANKVKGVYASVCHDTYSAHQGVEHDKMNALCIGTRVIGELLAKEIVKSFINARFLENEERFVRRSEKIAKVEEKG
jgi:ribose 5-phosphate isomerase B